jgi:hypothetical protein
VNAALHPDIPAVVTKDMRRLLDFVLVFIERSAWAGSTCDRSASDRWWISRVQLFS